MQKASLCMANENATHEYPRPLRPKELDLLEGVLPPDRPGYREYRELLSRMVALGEGRRGAGNLLLGFAGDRPDVTSPLAPVVAYGMLQTTNDIFSITVREYVGKQIDVEIVSSHQKEIPDHFEEKKRWTYSTWKPGDILPSSGERLREVPITSEFVLGIAANEKRVFLYDGLSGIVHLIPITNFYNELMLHKNIRDPKIALHSSLLFKDHRVYTDEDLRSAFVAYNKLKRRVSLVEPQQPGSEEGRLLGLLKAIWKKQYHA
jgi:hypothetical protein